MHVAVIGGGISGLACAYFLRRAGADVRLFEQAARFGGVIRSERDGGYLFELGPQSFLSNDVLLEIIEELGLKDELQVGDRRAARYVLLGGRLERAPMAPPSLFGTRLFGARTKFRLLTEPFRQTTPPDADESVADFVRRKFGRDLLENLVAPLVSGIYAGDPERLSLRAAFPFVHQWEREYGSVIRGAMKSRRAKDKPQHGLSSFRDGVETLPRALAESLGEAAITAATVGAIRPRPDTGYDLHVEQKGRAETLRADAVVLAVSASAAGNMLAPLAPRLGELLPAISYAPVVVVGHCYRRPAVKHLLEGFGYLVPRKEGLRTLGTVWCSSLFPGRAPEGMVNLTSFVGGALDPDAARLAEEELAAIVHREAAPVLGLAEGPAALRVVRYPAALPQYNLGHAQRMEAIRAELARLPGLFLTGNYLSGPSIGACAEQAHRTAQEVLRAQPAAAAHD